MTDVLFLLLSLVLFFGSVFGVIFAVGFAMGVVSKYRNEVEKEELAEYFDIDPMEKEDEQTD